MDINVIIVSLMVGIAASILGVFIILKRLALVSDVLSHVALPGMALSLFFGVNAFFGAFAALLLAVVGIYFLEKRSKISLETIVGIFFTMSLALGMVFFDNAEALAEGLFGNIESITQFDLYMALAVGGFIIFITLIFFRNFAHTTFSKELAQSEGFPVKKLNLIFLILLAGVIALGIKVAGTLLMGALTILPVSIAKNISGSLRMMTVLSVFFGILLVVLGLLASSFFQIPLSAAIILSGGVLFAISLIK
ncbi:metal ABC transporter permease [Candidatus Azambacteria bacterium]|nr:metal ABC transporter permease [Candidatus Azambacteria bacterium]